VPGKLLKAQVDTTRMTVLETVNSFQGHWYGTNEGYLYGSSYFNKRAVVRKAETGQNLEIRGDVTSLDTSYIEITKIFPATTPGLLFVLVQDRATRFCLLKSSDGGLTFKRVYIFGEGNGPGMGNSPSVRLLRGILELKRDVPGGGGKGTLYFGEYNINQNRVAGSVNDRVRIMKSVDNGDTWTKIMEWNTNGINQVGHIHAMQQDPYTGEIYICTGDSFLKAGLIKWDGTSPWIDNATLPTLRSMSGFSVLTGAQRYRVTDVLFDQNSFYTFADTQKPNNLNGTESGIWKGSKDFSSYRRVNNNVYGYDPMHIGWFGERMGNTFIFTTSREVEGTYKWKKLNLQVYTSTDGENWYVSGELRMRDMSPDTTIKYITNIFVLNSRIYIDCLGGSGHYSTIQCELSRKWRVTDDPVILHPVYFVGKWNSKGNDSNSGANPDAPKATLKNILEGSKIPAGARVRISAGTFMEGNISPDCSSTFIQGSGNILIEGKGMDSTFIVRSSAPGDASGMKIDRLKTRSGKNSPFTLKDLSYKNPMDGGTVHNSFVVDNLDSYLKTIGCRIGGEGNDDSPLINLSGANAGYISDSTWHISTSVPSVYKICVASNAQNQVINIRNSLFLKASDAVSCNFPGIDFSLKHCTFYGTERYGIIFYTPTTVQPVILNCVFSGANASINDLAGLNETNVDYNYYEKPNINVNGGTHSINDSGTPVFVDPEKGNFNLLSNSPVAMKGKYLPDVPYDITGRLRLNPPSPGAFESPVLVVNPSAVKVDSLSGSTGKILILSNSGWNVSGGAEWINIPKKTGSGSDTITVTTSSSNDSGDKRTCIIIFSGTGLVADTVTVLQPALKATGTTPVENKMIKIYPNPVSGNLTVDFGTEEFSEYSIISYEGVVLKKGETIIPVQQIDFSGFKEGVYFIRLTSPGMKVLKVQVIRH
jgi:hypothetical protein